MSVSQDWPTAMVVLASEQLWPNVHGLAHWQPNLKHLFIYSTRDSRSAPAAQRLQALCGEVWPHLSVRHHAGDMQPQAVIAQINAWQQAHPDHRWLINATGGTKLMHDGMIALVGRPNTQVVYRELDGVWYRFCNAAPLQTETIEVPINCTDSIPVEGLVRTQWLVNNHTIQFGAPPAPVNWRAALETGCRTRWNWREVRAAACDQVRDSNGLFFERLVELLLREMGLTNITRNVRRTAQKQHLQEIDLVVNQAGRLLILDCKLIDEAGEEDRAEPVMAQIRQAHQTYRELGGLGSGLLMVRPNRLFSPEEMELARAYRLDVADREACVSFFEVLAKFCCVSLPDSLRRAQGGFTQAWERDRVRPFSQETPPRRFTPESFDWNSQAVVDLDAYREQFEGQDWVAYALNPHIHVSAHVPEAMTRQQAEAKIEQLFGTLGLNPVSTFSATGKMCQIVLQRTRASWPELRALLESRMRRELLA